MATWTVKQSGGDYSTLASALSNASTGASDIISIEGTWSVDDTAVGTIADASLTIQCDADSKMVGYEAASPTNYRLKNTTGISITVDASGCVIDGIEIGNESTGTSDECIRLNVNDCTLTVKNSLLYFGSRNDQQDLIYINNKINPIINLENVFGYNAYRSGIGLYRTAATTITANVNSCSFSNLGYTSSLNTRSGMFGHSTNSHTAVLNCFNTLIHLNAATHDVCNIQNATNTTLNFDQCLTNSDEWCVESTGTPTENITGNSSLNYTFATTGATGNYVVVENITSGTDDMRLKDDTDNDAQDNHTDTTGPGSLSMPSTDALGTSRPQNTNYDIGAFEISAAAPAVGPNLLTLLGVG
jgi:hypothetical protein